MAGPSIPRRTSRCGCAQHVSGFRFVGEVAGPHLLICALWPAVQAARLMRIGCLSQDAWMRFLERTVVSNVPMLASPGCCPALLHDTLNDGYRVECRIQGSGLLPWQPRPGAAWSSRKA